MMKTALLKKHRLAKWDIAVATTDDLLAALDVWRHDARPHLVCFCDANGLAHGWREPEVAAAYRAADAVMADGIVVKTLVRLTGGHLPMRVCGPAFFERAMAYGVSRGWRHYFCGGVPGVAQTLKFKMEACCPGVQIVGVDCPPFADNPPVPAGVDADFVWVALGSPKQEKWAARHLTEFGGATVLPVGAAFDFLVGRQKAAPGWVQRIGGCWLWRLFSSWRTFRRNLWCLPRAAGILVKEAFS